MVCGNQAVAILPLSHAYALEIKLIFKKMFKISLIVCVCTLHCNLELDPPLGHAGDVFKQLCRCLTLHKSNTSECVCVCVCVCERERELFGVQACFRFHWVTFMKNCYKHLQSINRGLLTLVQLLQREPMRVHQSYFAQY